MRFKTIPILFVLVMSSTFCAPKTIISAPDKAVWYANQVAVRINELSKTIIHLNAQGQISDNDTRVFGTWATVALTTLRDVPAGWEKTVQTGWNVAKNKLPINVKTNPTVTIVITVLDSLLTLLNPIPVGD